MISQILSYVKNVRASDLHLSAGSFPMVRVDGDMLVIPDSQKMTAEDITTILDSFMNDVQKRAFAHNLEIDFSAPYDDELRFRVNAFHTIHGPAAAFREIPIKVKNLYEINAPESVRSLSACSKGLVLIVGPTGSGKSTTLAAMLDHINENSSSHIITIEDPVEFVHKNKRSLINQREVGSSTLSFNGALRGALREDPDIILIGEMRDLETIRLALTAAETGHLVFATLHTSSAAQTINRIIDSFPAEDKSLARSMLSVSLQAIVSQRLLKRIGGGRLAAHEVMISNSSIRNLIRDNKIPQINSAIELGRKQGMCLMKDSLNELLYNGFISRETVAEALLYNE